jgi:hypothetical protein
LIPGLMKELGDGSGGWPVDGQSLTNIMHRNGVNVRFLGKVVELCGEDPKLQAVNVPSSKSLSNVRLLHSTRWCRGLLNMPLRNTSADYRYWMSRASCHISSIVSSDSSSTPFHNHIFRITMNSLPFQRLNGPPSMHGVYKPK